MLKQVEKGKVQFPKRRKSKENPYTIGYDESRKSYFLVFLNTEGLKQKIYISIELYEAFNDFELEDLSQLNEQERHIDSTELTDEYLYKHLCISENLVEEELDRKLGEENIHNAIKTLSSTQKKRLILYYFYNFTYEQIARSEGCKYQSVQDSIKSAEEKIKKYLLK